jgi:hypothetical protein
MGRSVSKSALLDGVSRVHLEPAPKVSGALALNSASLDDLGARLLAEMSTAEHGESGAGVAVAVGERIRRGSLGGLVDAFSAMAMHEASPNDNDADEDAAAATSAGSASASAAAAAASPMPSPTNSKRPLGELSEWSSINPVVAANGGAQRNTSGVPFTLLWLKNRTVDLFLARFGALSSRLHEGAGAARALPPLLATFEAGLSDRHRERMAAVRAEEEAVRDREEKKRSANQASSAKVAGTAIVAAVGAPAPTSAAVPANRLTVAASSSTAKLHASSSNRKLHRPPQKQGSSVKKTART